MTDEAVTHRPQTTTIAMDAKPTKHTQTLALRKASGIVQMQNHISTQTIAVRKVIGIARFLKCVVWGEGQLAIIIQKRSQCSTVTALFINYCFV